MTPPFLPTLIFKIIVNGWKGAGILNAVSDCRNMNWESLLDPFTALSLSS